MLNHLHSIDSLPKRVVVVGAAGFVGSTIAQHLKVQGVEVLLISRTEVDLLDDQAHYKLARYLRDTDCVIATAAIAPCTSSDMLVDNLRIARCMIHAFNLAKVSHVINISSDAVFMDSMSPLTEDSHLAPDTTHGVMHLAREIIFRSELLVPLAILRPSLLYGEHDPHNGYGPNRFRRLAQINADIVLFGEGEELRDHVDVEDLARVVVNCTMRGSTGALTIATGQVVSFKEIANLMVKKHRSKSKIFFSQRISPMPHNGYRAFDIRSLRIAFPDFKFSSLL